MAVGGKQMNNRTAGGRQQYNLRVVATGGGPQAPPVVPLSPDSPTLRTVGVFTTTFSQGHGYRQANVTNMLAMPRAKNWGILQ